MANTVKNIGNASIFEKTMAACLESKRTATGKKITENKKVVKKATNKKVNESIKRRKLHEDEDLYDDEEIVDDTTMDDVVDDIVVVVDPEVSADEVDELGSEAQEIIDGTPEGEIPMTDEYVDDYTYTCPICGNTFFSDVEMHDGDECPVCGDYPNGYVLVGAVADPEEVVADEEDEEVFDDSADDVVDVTDDTEEVEDELEPAVDEEAFTRRARTAKKRVSKYSIDESTFNPFMNKFIRENYKNARAFNIKRATLSGKKLSLECVLLFKSGNKKNVTLRVENFVPARKMTLAAREDGTFKIESKKSKAAPFVFEAVMRNNVIKCTGMRYNFVTRAKNEGKNSLLQVSGKLVTENKRK